MERLDSFSSVSQGLCVCVCVCVRERDEEEMTMMMSKKKEKLAGKEDRSRNPGYDINIS